MASGSYMVGIIEFMLNITNYKNMRTKSAKDIYAQADRVLQGLAVTSWNGKEYENHACLVARLEKVSSICKKYVDNIYKHFGVDGLTCGANVANEIYVKQMPAAVYASNNN